MVTGVVPSPPRFSPSIYIAHRVQQSHCSSIFHRMLLTHAFVFSASQFVHKKKSPLIYTSMHSGGFELTKLTYTRLEDNLIRHRGDRQVYEVVIMCCDAAFVPMRCCDCCTFVFGTVPYREKNVINHINIMNQRKLKIGNIQQYFSAEDAISTTLATSCAVPYILPLGCAELYLHKRGVGTLYSYCRSVFS